MSDLCIKCEENSVSKKYSENSVLCAKCAALAFAELYEMEPSTQDDKVFAQWLRGNISWEECRDLIGGVK